jgi:hypothetical protein
VRTGARDLCTSDLSVFYTSQAQGTIPGISLETVTVPASEYLAHIIKQLNTDVAVYNSRLTSSVWNN